MINVLEKYSNAVGPSGNEWEIRDIIKEEIADYVDSIETDFMGNLYAYKSCGVKGAKKVLLIAHMDEVALMIDSVTSSGLLQFQTAGSIDPRVLVSKRVVVGKNKIPGVIGAKPIHLQGRGEWKSPIPVNNLYIDVGAKKDSEVQELVGEYAVFDTKFKYQEDVVFGKAFDDRAGCAVVTHILRGCDDEEPYPVDIVAVFSVQEEVGLRGASIVAERVKPDYTIAFEGTTAGDVPTTKDNSPSTEFRKGPAITVMDRTTIGFRELKEAFEKIAEKNNIPYQYKRTVTGGTDIGVIHTKGGIPSLVISVPVRYIHSPVGIVAVDDFKNTVLLSKLVLKNFKEVL